MLHLASNLLGLARNEDGGAAAGGEATSLALSALLELNLGQEHVVL